MNFGGRIMSNNGQKFGGSWTIVKLDKVEGYLSAFTIALKRVGFKLCYIDGFAGNGAVQLNNYETTDGSAIRALKYSFDRFYYIDKNEENCIKLNLLKEKYPDKDIRIYCGDCNTALHDITAFNWYNTNWRGVVFLDPFAMNVDWSTLEKLSKTGAFDIWYLFPISAMNRNLCKDGNIGEATHDTLNRFLGTAAWYDDLYRLPMQQSFLPDNDLERVDFSEIIQYVLRRLGELFEVSPNYLLLRNSKESPLFMLCFMMSNKAPKAVQLSMRIANHILTH